MPLNILYVDDQEGVASEYRDALRRTGNTVKAARTLKQALTLLIASFQDENKNYDLVLIDLMIRGEIPDDLKDSYQNIDRKNLNEGQALGQWLWTYPKSERGRNWPKHCYITNLPTQYSESKNNSIQEFGSVEEAKKFILDKPKIPPSELESTLLALPAY